MQLKKKIPLSERVYYLNRDLLVEMIEKSRVTKSKIASDIGLQQTQLQMAVAKIGSPTYRPIPYAHDKILFDYLTERISEVGTKQEQLSKLTIPKEEIESKMKWYENLKSAIANK